MTKADLVEAVYQNLENSKCTKRECAGIVEEIFEIIEENLSQGEAVKLSGFGNFIILTKNTRMGRNPKTREPVPIQARKVVTFKASQILKEKVNKET
ncbi:MAG: integration host factor subunit alpha [Magnetococcales bacterium]|nr:integration host factor subunit alpha [Magnetococcales bacterium]